MDPTGIHRTGHFTGAGMTDAGCPQAWKRTVARRFDGAADTYDKNADVQQAIACALRDLVLKEVQPEPNLTVLEIGCGTGFLTRTLLPELPLCRWIATDVSGRMLEHCQRHAGPDVEYRVMDGEAPDAIAANLIVSSMAVQWFADLPKGLARLHALLRPGGLLAITTLGVGTFSEWREICHAAGTPPYPSKESLQGGLGSGAFLQQTRWPIEFPSLNAFLYHLKSTGARTAAPGHSPLSASALRRILKAQEGQPFTATYDVLTVLWRK